MPTKKKSKAAGAANKGPADPRELLEPTPANLTAALKQLKAVLADIPIPDPIIEEPEPDPDPEPAPAPASGSDDGAEKAAEKEAKPAKPKEPITRLPQLDYIDALLHIYFATGLPCGYGQEVRRRIEESFVDRNEFRVTEAFEVEELLEDLEIPDLFARCLAVRESIAQIYNDQNGVHMHFLREAGIGDRQMFFQRVPAVEDHVVSFISNLLTYEEVVFSEKSTLRAQQRLGLDPKNSAVAKFVDELRACLKPYGHIPVSIGAEGKGGKPNLKHQLSPACILVRMAPLVKVKRR